MGRRSDYWPRGIHYRQKYHTDARLIASMLKSESHMVGGWRDVLGDIFLATSVVCVEMQFCFTWKPIFVKGYRIIQYSSFEKNETHAELRVAIRHNPKSIMQVIYVVVLCAMICLGSYIFMAVGRAEFIKGTLCFHSDLNVLMRFSVDSFRSLFELTLTQFSCEFCLASRGHSSGSSGRLLNNSIWPGFVTIACSNFTHVSVSLCQHFTPH